jgi:predicted metal-dependent hydrolase
MSPLPAYELRLHPRARRVTLRIAPGRGLTVTAPAGFDPAKLPAILEARQDWIDHHLARLARRGQAPDTAAALPDTVELRALDLSFSVDHAPRPGRAILRQNGPGRLLLAGPPDDPAALREQLMAWLRATARQRLTPWLRDLAQQTGLTFSHLTIRAQKSRWGSCTARHAVNLNCKLLFLPPELCRYVLLHELCHTRHLDHSAAYWKLVYSLEPDCHVLDKALRQAWRWVPAWAA